MAGLKAAATAPTWPDINGTWLPQQVHSWGNHEFKRVSFLWDNPLVIQFIHRNLAYIITLLVFAWWWRSRKTLGTVLFQKTRGLPLFMVSLQLLLGVFTVLDVFHPNSFLWLAVAHQFVALLLLLSNRCAKRHATLAVTCARECSARATGGRTR